MRRRAFLAGGATLAAAPAVAAGRTELTLATAWPRNTPGVGVNAQRFADALEAMSGGRLRVRLFAAGEIVPPFETLDAVQNGTVDMAHASPYYWVGKSRALHYFTGVPFGLLATEHAAWLYQGGGQALWEEVYAPFGIQPFYAGSSGAQAGGWLNREIERIEDFEGLKLRIAGLGAEVLKRVGVTPVTLPPGEIAPALMSGAVDGADWVGPWNDLAFGLHKAARYYYMPGFHEPGPSLEIILRKERFEALPADLQAIVRAAASHIANQTLADFLYHNATSLEALVERHGVELRRFPEPVLARLAAVTREVLDELAAADPLTGRVHRAYLGFLRRAVRYAARAEGGVHAMRRLALRAGGEA